MFKAIIFILCFIPVFSNAQKKIETIEIKTTVYCDHCKMCESCGLKLETDLYYVKGIKSVTYNEEKMIITLKYKTKKTSPDVIRKSIANLGFSADVVPANVEAYNKLDGCCKKK